jgi:hypothetical protein
MSLIDLLTFIRYFDRHTEYGFVADSTVLMAVVHSACKHLLFQGMADSYSLGISHYHLRSSAGRSQRHNHSMGRRSALNAAGHNLVAHESADSASCFPSTSQDR